MKTAEGTERIPWPSNAPATPHFNRFREAGMKSMKAHLTRVVNNQLFSYEEFSTILLQIGAMLNSGLLFPQRNDPNDISLLILGYFLTVEPLTPVSDPELSAFAAGYLEILAPNKFQYFAAAAKMVYRCSKFKWGRFGNNWGESGSSDYGRVMRNHPDANDKSQVAKVRTSQGTS